MSWKAALLAALSLFTALLLQRSALPLLSCPAQPLSRSWCSSWRSPWSRARWSAASSASAPAGGRPRAAGRRTAPVARRSSTASSATCAACSRGEVDRSAMAPIAVVAGASVVAVLGNAVIGVIFGGEHPTSSSLAHIVPAVVVYDVLLAPFIVPVVAVLVRRLDPEPRR